MQFFDNGAICESSLTWFWSIFIVITNKTYLLHKVTNAYVISPHVQLNTSEYLTKGCEGNVLFALTIEIVQNYVRDVLYVALIHTMYKCYHYRGSLTVIL